MQIEQARQWRLVETSFPTESGFVVVFSLLVRFLVLCAGLGFAYALVFHALTTSFPYTFFVALAGACAANFVAIHFSKEANMINPFWSDYVYWMCTAGLVVLFVAVPTQHSLYDPLLFACLALMYILPLPGYLLCALNLQKTATVRQILRYLASLPASDRAQAVKILLHR